MAALGAGAVAGALTVAFLSGARPRLSVLVTAAIILGVAILSLAVVHRFWMAMLFLILAGFSQIVFLAICNTTLQVTTPDRLRGRIMSLYAFVFAGVTPIGSFFIGSVAEILGIPAAFAVGGGLGLFCILGLTWRRSRGRSGWDLMVGWP
jgi:predicted MFS family arabinose efflux permease